MVTEKKKKLPRKPRKTFSRRHRNHKQFGTSKLEQDFAHDFLDKLGVKYTWQFEAKDIGRFFDYYLDEHRVLIEIDGSYYHSDPRIYEGKELNRMQKRNKTVDAIKDKWALMHSIPLVRIWEKDIRENPSKVMDDLKKRLYIEDGKNESKKRKNGRHNNKIK